MEICQQQLEKTTIFATYINSGQFLLDKVNGLPLDLVQISILQRR